MVQARTSTLLTELKARKRQDVGKVKLSLCTQTYRSKSSTVYSVSGQPLACTTMMSLPSFHFHSLTCVLSHFLVHVAVGVGNYSVDLASTYCFDWYPTNGVSLRMVRVEQLYISIFLFINWVGFRSTRIPH